MTGPDRTTAQSLPLHDPLVARVEPTMAHDDRAECDWAHLSARIYRLCVSLLGSHPVTSSPDAAADILEDLLKHVDEPGSRTAIRFALKDVYAELGRANDAARQMAQVIIENAKRIQADQGIQ